MARETKDLYAQIEARRAELGLSQAQLTQMAFGQDASSSAVQNIRRGSSPSYERLGAIADALGYELYFGPPRDSGPITTVLAGRDSRNFAAIPLHDADLAAGTGATNETEAVIGELAFRRDWLRRIGVSASSAVLARARGDSMAPTIRDRDMVLIDRARAAPPSKVRAPEDMRIPHIFALLDQDGSARVKRLDLAAPGMLAILSDNPAHSPEFRPVDEIKIIGRVRWWGHTERE